MPRPPAPPATVAAAVEGRSVYAAKRSPRRVAALVAVALIVVAAAAAVAVTALGGSSKDKAQTAAAKTATTPGGAHAKRSAHKAAPKAPTVSPAETTVTVLNATEAEGLAHRTASELQQNGYSEATAMNGKPPGSGLLSVVEYASGHKAEAEGVARSADVTHVEPIEAAVTALAGSANVVVIVGADKDKEASEASSP
jgi:LytR cell envelope-related transcriptional attenuator